MLKEVYPGIYLNEITLPNSPLKFLNSYIVVSDERTLIIDTGFNRPECKADFFAGIQQLGIDMAKTDVLVTHLHSDHCGLVGELQKQGAKILIGNKEVAAIKGLNTDGYWDKFREWAVLFDLVKFDIQISDHPGYSFRPEPITDCRELVEGEVLTFGKYNFEVVYVPGHTLGHIALYEREHKLFFGGDTVLDNITPTITFWGFEQDVLAVYLATLERLSKLDIDILFTSHRAIIKDHHRRISELKEHHAKRLAEIKVILAAGEKSVVDVAGEMTWSIRANSWGDFPKTQKWFATSEAMAHLEHLYCTGILKRREEAGKLFYSLQ